MSVPRHQLIALSDQAAWAAALEGVPHDFGHTWHHCNALSLTLHEQVVLYQYTRGRCRVVCPLVLRRAGAAIDVATPPGFSGFAASEPDPEFWAAWTSFGRDQGWIAAYVALNPVLNASCLVPDVVRQPYNAVYVLDLTLSHDQLVSRLDRNRRRELRASADLRLLDDRDRLTDFLVSEYPSFLRRIGASPAYQRSEATLRALCSAENTILLGIPGEEGVAAVYVFAYTPWVGTCLFHLAHPEARRFTTSLVWAGMQALRQRAVPVLNLGGGIRDDDPIAKAKQRFGSERRTLAAVQCVLRPELYLALCSQAGVDPDAAGFFPAYRRKAG